jgi:hypothetical protein
MGSFFQKAQVEAFAERLMRLNELRHIEYGLSTCSRRSCGQRLFLNLAGTLPRLGV